MEFHAVNKHVGCDDVVCLFTFARYLAGMGRGLVMQFYQLVHYVWNIPARKLREYRELFVDTVNRNFRSKGSHTLGDNNETFKKFDVLLIRKLVNGEEDFSLDQCAECFGVSGNASSG